MARLKGKGPDVLAGSARVPLVSVDRLRVRLDGRTLVDALEFDVEERGMVALVGPAGSGKTTVFDCIAGSRRPSGGSVRFRGRRLEKAFTPAVAWRIAGIGLLVGLAVAALAVDAGRLWWAVVTRGIATGEPFTPTGVGGRLRSYFRAELAIDRSARDRPVGEWRVVTADGRETLARCQSRAEAVAIRSALQAAVTARRAGPGTVPESTDMATVEEGTPGLAEEVLDRLAAGKRLIRRRGWTGLAAGWVVGVIAAAVDWRRGRRGPEVSARAGIARVFQSGRPFPGLTVLENVLVASDRPDRTPIGSRVSPAARDRARAELAFVGLTAEADAFAGRLPEPLRTRLEIARALATDGALMLLDDPAAGCDPEQVGELAELLRRIRARGVTVLVAERELGPLSRLADRVVTLDRGRKVADAAADPPRTS
jgi:ABC-type branched-subunit amino acid transport system ATPase component